MYIIHAVNIPLVSSKSVLFVVLGGLFGGRMVADGPEGRGRIGAGAREMQLTTNAEYTFSRHRLEWFIVTFRTSTCSQRRIIATRWISEEGNVMDGL